MILSELRDRMRSYANVDENRLDDDACDDFLNDAKDEICDLYPLLFGEELISTAFEEGGQTINPAADGSTVTAPLRMWYANDQGERAEVFQISWGEYVDQYGTAATATGGTGDPVRFAIFGTDALGNPTFYLGPIPDADRSPVYLAARVRLADLSTDVVSNKLSVVAPRAMIYRALMLAANYLELAERKPEWEENYNAQIKRLNVSHSQARTAGKSRRQMNEPG